MEQNKKLELRVDIGASSVKVDFNGKIFKFPTAIRKIDVIQGFNFKSSAIEYKGDKFIVGKIGAKNLLSRDFDFFKNFSALLVYVAKEKAGIKDTKDISLNIGFSYHYINNFKEIVKELECFKINGQEFCFKDINCFIQGQGVYNHLGLDGSVAIYDIGYHTNDLLIFDKDGELLENDSDKNGVVLMVTKLKNELNYSFDMELTEQEVNEALQAREITIDGELFSLEKQIDKLVEEYTTKIKAELKTRFGSVLRKCDYVVICGGGANYFKDLSFPKNTILEVDEFANAKGYFFN